MSIELPTIDGDDAAGQPRTRQRGVAIPTTGPAGKQNLLNLTPAEAARVLDDFAREHGQPAYRAGQVLERLWRQPAPSFDQITNLPKAFRALLDERFELPRLACAARQRSSDGTEKFLFRLTDGQAVETVAIPDGDRLT
ncbi:MAG: hypothetical protein JO180_11990, partial [Gemmatirosa sp.]|nr:hypothetical protein [Gemmatirosa sp.]